MWKTCSIFTHKQKFVENHLFFYLFFVDFSSFLTKRKNFSTFPHRFLFLLALDSAVVIHKELLENKGIPTFPPSFSRFVLGFPHGIYPQFVNLACGQPRFLHILGGNGGFWRLCIILYIYFFDEIFHPLTFIDKSRFYLIFRWKNTFPHYPHSFLGAKKERFFNRSFLLL